MIDKRIKDVTCPQCNKVFELSFSNYNGKFETLDVRSCPSWGVYDVSIKCPHCDYVESLFR